MNTTRYETASAPEPPAPEPMTEDPITEDPVTETGEPDARPPETAGLAPQVGAGSPTELLRQARLHWQTGDWHFLLDLPMTVVAAHPQRFELTLLIASARMQADQPEASKALLEQAKQWAGHLRDTAKLQLSDALNTFGRASLAAGRDEAATAYFRSAVQVMYPESYQEALADARGVREAVRLGLLPQAASRMDGQLQALKAEAAPNPVRLSIFETELELLQVELSLAQRRNQIYRAPAHARRGEDASDAASDAATSGRAEAPLQPAAPGQQPGAPVADDCSQLQDRAMSQLGQDLWVLERTGYKRGGFFVEFGATDGVLLSNTWLLETHFAWDGICAEPNPKFFAQLEANRSCQVSDQYIGGTTGELVEFILSDAYGGSSAYAGDDHHSSKRDAYRRAGRVQQLRSVSLHDFLCAHNAPHDIDYISIDTEGSEYEIIKAFPFASWRVRLFTIEHNFSPHRKAMRRLMEQHGYSCREAKWDDWYELT